MYLWRDRLKNKYYLGSHWGDEDDGYICSSTWMNRAYKRRPQDFKRRIVSRIDTSREDLLNEEQRFMDMIRIEEINVRYYNMTRIVKAHWAVYPDSRKTVGQKISESKTGKGTPKWKDPSERARKISETKKKRLAEAGGFSEEHRRKLAESHVGKVQTAESNARRSESLRRAYAEGRR